MQIRVTKTDGSIEPYLHTKVFGSMHRAMAVEQADCIETAQMLSDAVTYFLYQKDGQRSLTTENIHRMILKVLEGAGYSLAAECLNAHRLTRRMERRRIEVIDSENLIWDKGWIVRDLMNQYSIERSLARAIAGAVEETVLRMDVLRIRKGLIRHLMMTNMENLLDADRELKVAAVPSGAL
jgi:hypothetical protein